MTGLSWLKIATFIWFVTMCVLFFIPGSSLPKGGWFNAIPSFDKIVHIGLFAVLLFLFRTTYTEGISNRNLILLAMLYGLSVEIIQGLWIPGRSFDLFDLAADTAGAILGLYLRLALTKKNKPL